MRNGIVVRSVPWRVLRNMALINVVLPADATRKTAYQYGMAGLKQIDWLLWPDHGLACAVIHRLVALCRLVAAGVVPGPTMVVCILAASKPLLLGGSFDAGDFIEHLKRIKNGGE